MAELFLGLMSGTSMDGIDAALVDFADGEPHLRGALTHPWPAALRARLGQAAQGKPLTAAAFAELDSDAGAVFAEAALALLAQTQTPAHTVGALGSHGQTVAHNPNADTAFTLQLGDPNLIAERTGITTIADFRRRDIAAGGQGAPLAPAFHAAAFHSHNEDRVVLNVGGIANITYLPATPGTPIVGFDTGPGNCLMDAWTRRHRDQAYDEHGSWAAQGKIDEPLLQALLTDSYFGAPAPKSTGTDYFSPDWLQRQLDTRALRPVDIQTTLLELTVHSITAAIAATAVDARRVLICGGGAHNNQLCARLEQHLGLPIESTVRYGIDPDMVEAIAFAWLARQTLRGAPGNQPAVTGAAGPRVLGGIYHAG